MTQDAASFLTCQ